MEALEGVVVGELRDPSHQIVKGKRTKRQRPSSPIPFIVVSGHLPSGEGGEYSSNEETTTTTTENNNISNNDDDNNNHNNNDSTNNLRLSLAGSWDDDDNSTNTEDEDVARMLILLSQGNLRESSTKNDYLDHKYYSQSPKFTSKKYIETSSNATGKSGMFVYECKTCNRTFPSFQALGGHRASHSKPKNLAIEGIKKRPVSSVFIDDYDYDFYPSSSSSFARNNYRSNLTSSISHNLLMNRSTTSSPRIHECSYCGAEFTSGQALGGHMRRHRGSNGNNNSNYNYYYNNINHNNNTNNIQPLLALSPSLTGAFSVSQDSVGFKKQKIDNDGKDALSLSLSLDLNLPAPPPAESDQKIQEPSEHEFVAEKNSPSPQEKNEQQQTDNKESALSLSTTPTLVGCHY